MKKKIHIMQVTYGMGIGGMERVIMDLCRYVDPDKYRFSIVCTSVRGPLADQMEEEGVPVIYCENQSRMAKYMRGIELAKIFKRSDVDILHTHHTTAFVHGTLGAKLAKIPNLINTDHCKDYATVKKRWIFLEKLASRYAKNVIAVSGHTRDELIEFEGIESAKISVIRNGINITPGKNASVSKLKESFGFNHSDPIIGTVGRLETQKGLDLLLDAVPHFVKNYPNARFLVVGGGSQEQNLRDQVARLGISDNVVITGWRSDAVDLIQLFDCFVSTSNFEGLPMVLLEAMAQSKPIVACAVGGIPEVIIDGENGYLLKTRDPVGLSDLLESIFKDEIRRQKMGDVANDHYRNNYTAECMARKYEKIYSECLAGQ